jgi:diguanylate cyclase (GGDEF)-like protein
LSLENALRFRTAEKDAQIDFVTQLPNGRRFFVGLEAELNRSGRSGEPFAVVVCDLNSFKAVNDRQGHQAGDLLLRTIAAIFKECCRSYDMVARVGGDEYVFLFPGVRQETCTPLLQQIEESVSKAGREVKFDVQVTASIGAAYYPADGETAEALLGSADRRMYLHKRKHYENLAAQDITPVAMDAIA